MKSALENVGAAQRLLLTAIPILFAAHLAAAQETAPATRLANVDTDEVLTKGQIRCELGVRAFGGDEALNWMNGSLYYGLGSGADVSVRVAGSKIRTIPGANYDIDHGGVDREAMVRYHLHDVPGLAFGLGFSLANTAAQNGSHLTMEAMWSHPITDKAKLHLGGRAILVNDNNILGFSAGVEANVCAGWKFVGDATYLTRGDNTVNVGTGLHERTAVWGMALRYTPEATPDTFFEIGYGNATGVTTGTSLTPGIGSAKALYLGIGWKF